MTTAHRPTFDPARGKDLPTGPAYHQRLLPAHTKLKTRKPGQGGLDSEHRDLRAELLAAEAAARAKKEGRAVTPELIAGGRKRESSRIEEGEAEDVEAKRRRILAETRELDADSDEDSDDDDSEAKKSKPKSDTAEDDDDDDSDDSDSSDDDEEEDETAELLRELENIKRERAEAREKEEREKEAVEQAQRELDIARGNPLLNPKSPADFNVKRRWDDDVIFKNQARGASDEKSGQKKGFVNDLLRSDFHRKFMVSLSPGKRR